MPLTATERLELLETWSRRSFLAMASCAVLLGLMLIHMIYTQMAFATWRAAGEARNAKLDRESEELKKEAAKSEAAFDARIAQNQKNMDDLKKMQVARPNFTPDARLDPAEEKKDPE